MNRLRALVAVAVVVSFCSLLPRAACAERLMERLGRGVVATHTSEGKVFVSWRLLATDPENVAFNVYRATAPGERRPAPGGGPPETEEGPVKLNDAPLGNVTWLIDTGARLYRETQYSVRAVIDGKEGEASAPFRLPANAPPLPYVSVPLQTPEGYTPGDASLGDLDGDGEYEIVLKQEQTPRDNSRGGRTGDTLLQAYTIDGRLLWTIHLGPNIREGAHYTQFLVYDLDGDGRAEIACKTADGTIDGKGVVIGDAKADWVQPEGAVAKVSTVRRGETVERDVNLAGHVLSGPEYLTVFDGQTGAARATVPYVPERVKGTTELRPQALADTWGDASGNRSDRYLAAVAYLDGHRPSLVFCRGYYTRAVLAAWDFRDGRLAPRWVFDSDDGTPGNEAYRGQGNHNLSVADVDGDGRDEIVYGAAVIDDDGRGLYSTGWGHGDAMHVSDLVPARPGLEIFNIQERFAGEGMNMREARTGKPIFVVPSVAAAESGGDRGEGPGRGASFDIDPRFPGAESWAAGAGMDGLYDAKGQRCVEKRPPGFPVNFAVWWDGDRLRELLDRNVISKWNWETGRLDPLLVAHACTSNNGTKSTPAVSADLRGDWREEVVWRTRDNKELRIYTTTIPTPHRMVTLMHDPQYRLAVAWQNVAYNQPPHPSFALDDAVPRPSRPRVEVAGTAPR